MTLSLRTTFDDTLCIQALLGPKPSTLETLLSSVWGGWEASSGTAREAAAACFADCLCWAVASVPTLSASSAAATPPPAPHPAATSRGAKPHTDDSAPAVDVAAAAGDSVAGGVSLAEAEGANAFCAALIPAALSRRAVPAALHSAGGIGDAGIKAVLGCASGLCSLRGVFYFVF